MRFITEFKITKVDKEYANWLEFLLAKQMHDRQADMGIMIADSFGWENPVLDNDLHYLLEIEAFPIDKWIEFRNQLIDALPEHDVASRTRIMNILQQLESNYKPASVDK